MKHRKNAEYETVEKYASVALDPKKLKNLGGRVNKQSQTRNKKMLKTFLPEHLIGNLGKVPYFIGSSSAKVVHSATQGWVNAVMYASPADRAMLSFFREFVHSDPALSRSLLENIKKASIEEPMWKPFTHYNQTAMKSFHEAFDAIIGANKYDPDFRLPDAGNAVHPFSMCPDASPNCRAVCLNTAGRAGMESGPKKYAAVAASKEWNDYIKERATGLSDGKTVVDFYKYFYLTGRIANYGGEVSNIQAARLRRTHIMWLSWAYEGVLQNTFNDMLYYEAALYRSEVLKTGFKYLALRINGTSDIPVHTLRLSNAVDASGKSLKGRNLIAELGKLGIICYDYTKDKIKMDSWMAANNWKGIDKALSGKVTVKNSWPSNYHLCFSWSEVNGIKALDTLKKGGNVVMVFRKSTEDGKSKWQLPAKITEKSTKGKFLPDVIHVAQLSKNPDYRGWYANIVNGDLTDLRFDDPYLVGNREGGVIVALIAKGEAAKAKPFDKKQSDAIWKRFILPVTMKQREMGDLEAQIRPNPPEDEDTLEAVHTVDKDLLSQAVSVVDGFIITTTAMGT